MLDIDSLMTEDVPMDEIDLKFLENLSTSTFNIDIFCEAIHKDLVPDHIYQKVMQFAYANDLRDTNLFNAFFKHSLHGDNSALAMIYKDVYLYYTDQNHELKVPSFNSSMSKLDPAKEITQYLLTSIWSDFDLSVKLTDSLTIDRYNSPQVVLLSISTWWPNMVTDIASLSSLYDDSELPSIFFEQAKHSDFNSKPVLDDILELFNVNY